MKEIHIQDLKPGLIPGLAVAMPGDGPYSEGNFEWTASPITPTFHGRDVSGGTLKAWKSAPCFSQIETHVDAELFFFLEGTAIMLFADVREGKPDPASLQIVRIPAGTRIIIPEGKGHFVPVAADDTPVSIVVVAPKMDAPRIPLPDMVRGL